MRLLVLGGTVFLGRHVVEEALARGHEVTGAVRDPARLDFREGRVAVAVADATDPASIAAAAAGQDAALSAVKIDGLSSAIFMRRERAAL